ncbi:MAG: oligosaccharide flippase family protein, partial [Cetobacterium sp.]|uniref:oligosaccharide flippase family protein n=1 Tax=Cetobacterium sp. TaxID=2071632 RepID=UPI003F32B621
MNQIKNFSIYGISKLFSSLISFLIVPIYSFFLSESDFGKIAIISTIIAFVSIFINCSLTVDYTLSFFKIHKKERESYRINIIYFSIFMYIIWNILLYMFFKEIETKLKLEILFKDYLKIISISFLNSINNFLLEDSKMLGNAKEFAVSNLLIVIINSFFILIGVKYLSLGLIGFIDAQFFSSALIFILLVFKERIQGNNKLSKLNISKIKKGLLFGYPIMITFVFSYFSTYADRYILQDLTDYKLLGLYSMGYKFGEAFNIVIVNSYILAVHPILLKVYSESLEEYKDKLKLFYDYFI